MVRFDCAGDRKGRKNGWAILYLDERPAGAFGNWKANTGTLKWKANSDRPALSTEERAALQREWNEKKAERERNKMEAQRIAALDAADVWNRSQPASSMHPYVRAKRIRSHLLKQDGDKLVVPMWSDDGLLWNVQRIAPDGEKRFLEGGRIDNLFAIIGTIEGAREAIFCEGYSTGDSIEQATGIPVIVTFNTSNLPKVCRLWAERRPDLSYTVFADDDHATGLGFEQRTGAYKNPGIEAAEAAASLIGARVAYPTSSPHRRTQGAA
jgi:putative DNA primase/helicase